MLYNVHKDSVILEHVRVEQDRSVLSHLPDNYHTDE